MAGACYAIAVAVAAAIHGTAHVRSSRPRNATVTTMENATLYELGKEEFLAAVTGNPSSNREADDLVSTRLAELERDARG